MPRAGLNRAIVLQAAAEIADKEGLAAVTFARLAPALGVKAPSLYNHVASLADVLDGLAAAAIEGLLQDARIVAQSHAEHHLLAALAHSQRAYARRHPGLYEASLRSLHRGCPETAALADRYIAVFLAPLMAMGHHGDDALHLVRALRAAVSGFIEIERRGGFGMALDVDVSFERMLALLMAGLSAGGCQNATE
jgi:AcrR family transcriptional regulator